MKDLKVGMRVSGEIVHHNPSVIKKPTSIKGEIVTILENTVIVNCADLGNVVVKKSKLSILNDN